MIHDKFEAEDIAVETICCRRFGSRNIGDDSFYLHMLLAKTSYGYHYTLVKIHPYPKCFVAKLSPEQRMRLLF